MSRHQMDCSAISWKFTKLIKTTHVYEKYKDMEQLLPYIPPVHEYFKTLPHKEHK